MPSSGESRLDHSGGKKKHALAGLAAGTAVQANDVAKISKFEELEGLDFSFISYDENTVFSHDFFQLLKSSFDLIKLFDPIFKELEVREKAGQPPPTCIIYDRYCVGAVDIAKKIGVPSYIFYSCGAVHARFLQEAPRMLTGKGPFPLKDDGTMEPVAGRVDIPGLPPMTGPDLLENTFTDPCWRIRIGQAMAESSGVIINTFYELEKPQIDEIRRQCAEQAAASGRKTSEVFPVGPLSEAATFRDRSFVQGASAGSSERAESLQWLDSQRPHSVLYICLGSWVRWKPRQVEELALSLEASGQSFLWVLSRSQEALPAGFEDRVRDSGKGYIASGWVPQLHILQHASIGGFLSHCGWNSTIESISLGVPMLCWPQNAEQPLNCRYIVDVLKVGIQVGHMTFAGPALVKRDEFQRVFRILLEDDEGEAMRSRAQQLKLKAEEAVAAGGVTQRVLDELTEMIPVQTA
ncbi:hypothetical protein R1sor_021945 [Riccia sorocarpa]|uniref:Glycosyltransferase n=1 Tax=Riccia sorocarpa TaxID=122646 RepID=A0ABD3GKM6_9MARC